MVTSNPVSTSSSSNDDAAVKASLRTAVEDKIRRRTRALFEQAQVGNSSWHYTKRSVSFQRGTNERAKYTLREKNSDESLTLEKSP